MKIKHEQGSVALTRTRRRDHFAGGSQTDHSPPTTSSANCWTRAHRAVSECLGDSRNGRSPSKGDDLRSSVGDAGFDLLRPFGSESVR